MKIPIGWKIGLLTAVLTFAAAWYASSRVYGLSITHVVGHEIVDLADETQLSVERISNYVNGVKSKVEGFAKAISQLRLSKGITAKDQKNAISEIETQAFQKDEKDVLRIEVFNRDPSTGKLELNSEPLVRVSRADVRRVESLTNDTELATLIAGLRDREVGFTNLRRTNVRFQRNAQGSKDAGVSDQPAVSETPGQIRITLRAAMLLPLDSVVTLDNRAHDNRAHDNRAHDSVLVADIHFRILDSDYSHDEQTAISPRHFPFVRTPDGTFVQFPESTLDASHFATASDTKPDVVNAVEKVITKIQDSYNIKNPTEQERIRRDHGETDDHLQIPELQCQFAFSGIIDPEICSVFDPRSADLKQPEITDRRDKILKAFREFGRQHPKYKISTPMRDNPRFKVRSESAAARDMTQLQQDLVLFLNEQLRPYHLQCTPSWSRVVPLKTFAIHAIRLKFDSPEAPRFVNDYFADLAVAVSEDEIAADVTDELRVTFWYSVGMAAGAALLAALFSLVITRPINKIIDSTERLARGEQCRALPLADRGEIGVLARSLKRMVDEIQDRNLALAREQAVINSLNVELKLEKDLLERRVKERTVELTNANDDLSAARDQALEANRAKSAFLANMSHELRTPLNAIIGYTEMLEEDAVDSPTEAIVPDLHKILEASKHLLALINDILDLAKIEAGRVELFPEEVNARELLESVVSTVLPIAAKKGNRVEWECTDDLITMRVDRLKTRQVLLNLLSNATKFTEHGTVKIIASTEFSEGVQRAVIRVVDSGIGMSQLTVNKLFQNFTQADGSTSRKYGGTGLGLAISKKLAQMMGGDITVASEVGVGSTFTFRVPLEEPAAASTTSEEGTSQVIVGPSPHTVLVIDDDPLARDLLQRQLAREGFAIATAKSGQEGLELAKKILPLFITLDVMMPGMDGWEVLAKLKADPELAVIPVVLVTIVDDCQLGKSLGASECLTKPIDRPLLSAVANRIRGELENQAPILIVGDKPETRRVMAQSLRDHGWKVSEIQNHEHSALEQVGLLRPSLILLDLISPSTAGFAFLSALHDLPGGNSIPVIVVASQEIDVDEKQRLDVAAQQVLQKGTFTHQQLMNVVNHYIHLTNMPRAVVTEIESAGSSNS